MPKTASKVLGRREDWKTIRKFRSCNVYLGVCIAVIQTVGVGPVFGKKLKIR